MADEEPLAPAYTFFLAWFGFAMVAFPFVATLDAAVFDGRLEGPAVPLGSVVLALPAALEFAFSGRDPVLVGKYVVAFVVLYFVAIVAQATVYVVLGVPEPIPVAEFLVLFAVYVVTYVLVYKRGLDRLRAATAG